MLQCSPDQELFPQRVKKSAIDALPVRYVARFAIDDQLYFEYILSVGRCRFDGNSLRYTQVERRQPGHAFDAVGMSVVMFELFLNHVLRHEVADAVLFVGAEPLTKKRVHPRSLRPGDCKRQWNDPVVAIRVRNAPGAIDCWCCNFGRLAGRIDRR